MTVYDATFADKTGVLVDRMDAPLPGCRSLLDINAGLRTPTAQGFADVVEACHWHRPLLIGGYPYPTPKHEPDLYCVNLEETGDDGPRLAGEIVPALANWYKAKLTTFAPCCIDGSLVSDMSALQSDPNWNIDTVLLGRMMQYRDANRAWLDRLDVLTVPLYPSASPDLNMGNIVGQLNLLKLARVLYQGRKLAMWVCITPDNAPPIPDDQQRQWAAMLRRSGADVVVWDDRSRATAFVGYLLGHTVATNVAGG